MNLNANGHRGFATTTAIGITIPNIAAYLLVALLLGLLIAAGGSTLLIRTGRPHGDEPSSTTRATSAVAHATL